MEKTIEVKVEDIKRAFCKIDENIKETLLDLIPQFKEAIPITERVKTFEDACRELGKDHPFVLAYQNTNLRDPEVADDNKDVIAYLKLRIISAALNEGWKPKFVKGEFRYFPYFYLCSDEDISRISEKEKSRVVYRPNYGAYENGGMAYEIAKDGSASFFATFIPLLVFKTRELAEYAGKQFANLYADYLLEA